MAEGAIDAATNAFNQSDAAIAGLLGKLDNTNGTHDGTLTLTGNGGTLGTLGYGSGGYLQIQTGTNGGTGGITVYAPEIDINGNVDIWNGTLSVGGVNVMDAIANAGGGGTNHTHTIANVTGLQAALDAKASLAGADFTGNTSAPVLTAYNVNGITQVSAPEIYCDNLISYAGIQTEGDLTVANSASINNGLTVAGGAFTINGADGGITSNNYSINGEGAGSFNVLNVSEDIYAGYLAVNGQSTFNDNVVTTNDITAGGNVTAVTFFGSGASLTGLTKAQVGLSNVDNTSDANKPISTAAQTALNGKANTTHTHAISDTTGLQAALDGKAATSHTHTIANVTGLQTAIDGKAATSHVHSGADITSGTVADARLSTAAQGSIGVTTWATTNYAVTYAESMTLTPTNGKTQAITLTGNPTINVSAAVTTGAELIIQLTQDATGSRTVTWGSNVAFGSDIASVTLSTAASKVDFVGLKWHAGKAKWLVVSVARGY